VLEVGINVSPADYPNNTTKFVRIELGANLTDVISEMVLLPYNFTPPLREGGNTVSEAENRVYITAERKIAEEYKNKLSNYLSQLLPIK
jgi:lysophospholipase L1-like esterase